MLFLGWCWKWVGWGYDNGDDWCVLSVEIGWIWVMYKRCGYLGCEGYDLVWCEMWIGVEGEVVDWDFGGVFCVGGGWKWWRLWYVVFNIVVYREEVGVC